MIQMVNLQAEYLALKAEIDEAMQEVLGSGYFIGGPKVKQFAEEFATYMQTKQVIPCANGTDALQIAFMALDLQPGDEIIIPAFTYVAPAEAAVLLGMKPVFVDVNEESFCIDVDKIESKITEKTKAIVGVHLFGQAADMESIVAIAKKHNLFVIEDNAQATGATRNGKLSGTFGEFGTTSFFPSKNLGCYGDGGALFTDNTELAAKAKQVASHGQSGKKFYHDAVGINSRLDAMQAAILSVKLKRIEDFIANRKTVGQSYSKELNGIEGLKLPQTSAGNEHTFHQFVIRVAADKRDSLREHLKNDGIASGIYYPHIIPDLPPYKDEGHYPISQKLKQEIVALPVHPFLTEEEQQKIIQSVKDFYNA